MFPICLSSERGGERVFLTINRHRRKQSCAASIIRRLAGGIYVVRRKANINWNLILGTLPLLFVLISSGDAAELLRDKHTDTTYIFKSDAKDISVRINQQEAVLRADEWATQFYGDALFRFLSCQFKSKPIGYWLVTFQKTETAQLFYAVVLPDGRIVIPSVERGL